MKKVFAFVFALMLSASLFLLPASAAYPTPDPNRTCSFEIIYDYGEETFPGLEIKIYRVADFNEEINFVLSGDFKNYPIKIYDIMSQAEWRIIADTLAAYAVADKITPTGVQTTNQNGRVKFENLLPGLYLTLGVQQNKEGKITHFQNFMSVLPRPQEDKQGELLYDVVAYPKKGQLQPTGDDVEYKVLKQWKDTGKENGRTASVKIDLYKDGSFVKNVLLSAENNWAYTWIAPDDGSVWTVLEREVPKGYGVGVAQKGHTFIVTNNSETPPPPPPDTHDRILWPYLLGAGVAGLTGILAIAVGKKKRV